ncbi:Ribosomal protein L6 family [Euphorbia peplus]|nr:Ribosomal protein L6 family [Euphorbia peplus]
MASSFTSSFQTSNMRSVFWGDRNGFCIPIVPTTPCIGFQRKTIECKESRIGKQPISVPSNVTITLNGQELKVKGPLGELSRSYPREVKLERDEAGVIRVSKAMETRRANQMHGLFRTLTDNMVVGVSKGFEKRLQLVGVGYRGTVEGKDLVLSLGFSHPVRMPIPDDLQVKVEENTRIIISGYDKCNIGQFAASVRKWRPPEPYKGKGVRYVNEVIRLKEGKAGKKK